MTTLKLKTMISSLAIGLVLTAAVHAQEPMKMGQMKMGHMKTGPMKGMSQKGSKGTMPGKMKGNGGMMGGMMQKMQADTKAMDDELDRLVATMNQATGSDKMDAMAAVITKMAQQRKTMDQKMAAMQKSMMQGMMGHGMMGGMSGGMKMPSTTAPPTMDPSMTMPPSK